MTISQQAPFNILIVAQAGRLGYEAVLFAASLRQSNPAFAGRLIVAEPQPGPLWPGADPRIADPAVRACLLDLGAEITPLHSAHFGAAYPQGTRAEALSLLPPDAPFVAFDTDTVITGPLSTLPFDFARPSASMRREDSWPKPPLYGPSRAAIWGALYAQAGLDMASSLDTTCTEDDWRRYLYFNAGWCFYQDPARFGRTWVAGMERIRTSPPPELASQALTPWLDQIALPLVIHEFGGGRPGPELAGLDDGRIACHWRVLPLAYARESDHVIEAIESAARPNRIKKVLKAYAPFRRMIYQGQGAAARGLFDRSRLPPTEQPIRARLRKEELWMR